MLMAVLYDHPRDMPDYWVVRIWHLGPGGEPKRHIHAAGFVELDNARAFIKQEWPRMGLIQAQGQDDDPVVFEVYA